MTNEFDSIFSEVMESTTKPSIQTSNADDMADLDELISMAADEQNKHFYPHLPPDLPTNPDEILLPGEDDDDETPTSPISKAVTLFTPELNNSADSSIGTSRSFIFILELLMIIEINEDASWVLTIIFSLELEPVGEKKDPEKIKCLLQHNLDLQKPLEKLIKDLKLRLVHLKTKKLLINAEIDEEHDRQFSKVRDVQNGETLSSFQKPYFFDRINNLSPYNDPEIDFPRDKMMFCEDFVMSQMDFELGPRQEQMLKNLIRHEVEAKLKDEVNESLMNDERRWWDRLMNRFSKGEHDFEEVESEVAKIKAKSMKKLKSTLQEVKQKGDAVIAENVDVDWELIACKLNTLSYQCNVRMASKRITHLTSRDKIQYGANGVHPFQAYLHWDRKLHPDLRKTKITAKEIQEINEMREKDMSWIDIAKQLSKPDARVTTMTVFKAFVGQTKKKGKRKKDKENAEAWFLSDFWLSSSVNIHVYFI